MTGRETGTVLVVADDRDETADRVCTVLAERDAEVADDPVESYSAVDPEALSDDSAFGLIAQSVLAGVVSRRIYLDDGENLGTEIGTKDGSSWAVVRHDADGERGVRVLQAGLGGSGTRSRPFIESGLHTTGPTMIGSGSPSAAGRPRCCGWTDPTARSGA